MDGFWGGFLLGLLLVGSGWLLDRTFLVRLSQVNREVKLVDDLAAAQAARNTWQKKYDRLHLLCQQLLTRLRKDHHGPPPASGLPGSDESGAQPG